MRGQASRATRGERTARLGLGRKARPHKLNATYNDVLEVLVVRLLVDPRIHDLGLLGLQGLQLLLGKVLDVPVVLLLRVRPLKVLVLRS